MSTKELKGVTGLLHLELHKITNLRSSRSSEIFTICECFSKNETFILLKKKAARGKCQTDLELNISANLELLETLGIKFYFADKQESKKTLKKKEQDLLGLCSYDLMKHFTLYKYEKHSIQLQIFPQGDADVTFQVISPEVLLTRRQSLVNLKVCTASAAKTPRGLFGVPLEKNALPCFQYIPLVVLRCIRAVELFGMKEVGIYRVSGNKTVIDEFKSLLDKNRDVSFTPENNQNIKEGRTFTIHVVSCLLKQYFADLPDPLLTETLYPEYLQCSSIQDLEEKKNELMRINSLLPLPNLATFSFLMAHLLRVSEQVEFNQMTHKALSTCIAPAILFTRDVKNWNPTKGNELVEFALNQWGRMYGETGSVSNMVDLEPHYGLKSDSVSFVLPANAESLMAPLTQEAPTTLKDTDDMEGRDADEFDGFINEIIERKFSFQVNVSRADPSTLIDVTVDEETTDSDAESKEKEADALLVRHRIIFFQEKINQSKQTGK